MIATLLAVSTFSMLASLAKAETSVTLRVDPSLIEYQTPAFGEAFTINVSILNVINLYGFEFELYYDTSLLDTFKLLKAHF